MEDKKEPFKVVVLTGDTNGDLDLSKQEICDVNQFCRDQSIPMISTSVEGCSARIFTDFGPNFKVIEQNSEEIVDVMIEKITKVDETIAEIKLQEGYNLDQFQDGDSILLDEIKGMDGLQQSEEQQIDSSATKKGSINGQTF